MKKCSFCETENTDDALTCESCGKSFQEEVGIKIGNKTVAAIVLVLLAIVVFISVKTYDKLNYNKISLPDNKYNISVADYKIPAKWLYADNIFYNQNSIPNLLTFYIVTVNPDKNAEFRCFSTQFETEDLDVSDNKAVNAPFDYDAFVTDVVKKMSPNAENISLIKINPPSKDEMKKAKEDAEFYSSLYYEINPGTQKGSTWLNNYAVQPVHYLFSYKENGHEYYQMIDAKISSFVQCFSRDEKNIKSATKFVKCESMFSYKTLAENFDKNLRKYNTFKREMKINPQWIAKSYDERRSYISQADYITTQTLSGGNKFSQEELKNMVYAIEFLDEKSKSVIKSRYKTTWKTYLEKLF